jgi:prolyl oligopeptidase
MRTFSQRDGESDAQMIASAPAYPPAPQSDQVDDYHGVRVADPFRPLEDLDTPETRAWIAAETRLADAFFAGIPERDALRRRLTAVWDYERFGTPTRIGESYVFAKNTGLQNQSVLFIAPALDGDARVLLDPNALSADGTVALTGIAFTDDGRFMAYATSASGSDWMTWHVRDVATRVDLPDEVRWSKFSGAAWTLDGRGFYYGRYAEPDPAQQFKDENYNQQLCFHELGTSQAADVVVYARPDHPDWTIAAEVSEDGRWLVLTAHRGTDPNNRIFLIDLAGDATQVIDLLPEGDARYDFIASDGATFYFKTTLAAERGRVIAVDVDDRTPREIVAESADLLEGVAIFGDRFVVQYLHDAHSAVRRYDLQGTDLGDVALPGLGTVSGFGGKRRANETFYAFASYTHPTSIYRLDPATGVSTLVFAPTVDFDPDDFVSEQRFYTSADGTRVPMIVTYRKGLVRDGRNPTILYGYGGFNISLSPGFSPAVLVWLERGGIWAVPNIRGGGEYGEAWHRAGTLAHKQNVFDDFIAAAEHLIANGYTSTPKLAIYGGSNGGLLVGACMTQRPDLFAAAIPAVGVLDMLRFQKFTIGWAWTSDYGSADDADAFRYLLAYSPLHNLRPGTHYPATLIETADHDDRVFPAHSFKFAAALQAAQGGPAPILIRIETKAGHGAGKPTGKLIDAAADRYAFLMKVLDAGGAESAA